MRLPLLSTCTLKGLTLATKKTPNEQTSARVAATAAKLLSNPKTPAAVRSVAASALTQRPASMPKNKR